MHFMLRHWLVVVLVAVAGSGVLMAADTEAGTTEAVGFGGLVAGIGTHGALGGGIAYAATDRILAVAELSYIPTGGVSGSVAGFSFKSSSRVFGLDGGIHYQFPKDEKLIPYVAAGVGVLHGSGSFSTTGVGSTSISSTDLYFNFGGGLRYYLADNWGIRPELKIFAGDETFVRIGVGIFYQFGK